MNSFAESTMRSLIPLLPSLTSDCFSLAPDSPRRARLRAKLRDRYQYPSRFLGGVTSENIQSSFTDFVVAGTSDHVADGRRLPFGCHESNRAQEICRSNGDFAFGICS